MPYKHASTAKRRSSARPRRRPLLCETLEGRELLAFNFSGAAGFGTNQIETTGTAVDSSGNSYVSGSFLGSVDFDPAAAHAGNTDLATSAGGRDAFVAKFSPQGAFLWVRAVGGTFDDRATGVALDSSGNAYLTGFFTGTVAFGAGHNLTTGAGGTSADVFIWKLDPSGNTTLAVNAPGSTNRADQAFGIAVKPDGSAIAITGFISQATTFGATTLTPVTATTADAFVALAGPTGTFAWAKSFAGTDGSIGQGQRVTFDSAGNVVSTGGLRGTVDLDPGAGQSLATAADIDAYVSKLDGAGNFVFGRSFSGTGLGLGSDVTTDASNNVYATGRYEGSSDFDTSTVQPGGADILTSPAGSVSYYVVKLSPAGAFTWVRDLGARTNTTTADATRASLLAVPSGVIVAASFSGTATVGGRTLTSQGGSDVLVARITPGGVTVDAAAIGGAGNETANGLARTASGGITLSGSYTQAFSAGITPLTAPGAQNVFVTHLSNPATLGDFDGDGKADLGVFRPTTSEWLVLQSTAGGKVVPFGQAGVDIPVPADYDGDGIEDFAVYRPTTAQWLILLSGGGGKVVTFGQAGVDIPVPADYDGDGKADIAVFRPGSASTAGLWLISQSTAGPKGQTFGGGTDVPVPADYDGDGKADIAVFRPSAAAGAAGNWFILQSTAGPKGQVFGAGTDAPVPADYDGDGKADLGVFRPSTAQWFIIKTTAGPFGTALGGANLDQPVPADYDGDGKADIAVFRPTTAQWFIIKSQDGPFGTTFGQANVDRPLTAAPTYRYLGSLGGSFQPRSVSTRSSASGSGGAARSAALPTNSYPLSTPVSRVVNQSDPNTSDDRLGV